MRTLSFLFVCIVLWGFQWHPPVFAADTSADNPDLVKCGDDIDIKEEGNNICYYNECSVCDLQKLAQNVLNYFVILVVVVAMLVFTNAGVLYATSSAKPGNIAKAHKMFTSALVGLVVVLGAYLLINTLMWALYEGGDFGDWKSFLCHNETNRHCVPKVKTMTLKPSGIEGGPPSGFTCSSYGGQCVIVGVCAEWIKQSPGYWTARSDSTGCSKRDDICCVPLNPSDPSTTCDQLGGTCSKECQATDVKRTNVSKCSDTCCLPEHTGDSCEFEEGSWTLNPKKVQGTCQNEGFCKGTGKQVTACGSTLYCCPNLETPPPAGGYDKTKITYEEAIAMLDKAGVPHNGASSGPDIEKGVIDNIIRMYGACGCFNVNSLSGGHDAGSHHNDGIKADLSTGADSYIKNNFTLTQHRGGGYPGDNYRDSANNINCVRESSHWDCCFNDTDSMCS